MQAQVNSRNLAHGPYLGLDPDFYGKTLDLFSNNFLTSRVINLLICERQSSEC